jgi:hypothetical protein
MTQALNAHMNNKKIKINKKRKNIQYDSHSAALESKLFIEREILQKQSSGGKSLPL